MPDDNIKMMAAVTTGNGGYDKLEYRAGWCQTNANQSLQGQ